MIGSGQCIQTRFRARVPKCIEYGRPEEIFQIYGRDRRREHIRVSCFSFR
jgi:hypothetical protein